MWGRYFAAWCCWLSMLPGWVFAETAVSDPSLAFVSELQRGGYVIFFRHAATDHNQNDALPTSLNNCALQRNLDPRGKAQARAIGEAFTRLHIPVGEVLSSEFCRCVDTGNLAFGRATVYPKLTSYVNVAEEEKQGRVNAIRLLLTQPPAAGTNNVLVAHKYMFEDASGLALEEGEAAVFLPLGSRGFRLIARVTAEGWGTLAAKLAALD